MKIQTRYAVLAKPTMVAKLMSKSKNFSTCNRNFIESSDLVSAYGRVVTLLWDRRDLTMDPLENYARTSGHCPFKNSRTFLLNSSGLDMLTI